MLQSELQPALRVREDWRRRRRRGRLFAIAGWTVTALAICWLLLVAFAGLRPA